jgi:hypothetical protein
MAYRVENTGSLDYQLAIGVSLPFNAGGVFTSTYTSTDQIRADLINFILTNKGERPMTNYGSDLRKYLFSEITDSSYAFGITGTDNRNTPQGYVDEFGHTTPIPHVQPYTNIGIKDLEIQLKQEIKNNFPQLVIKQVSITLLQDNNTVTVSVIYTFMTDENHQIILNI